ncbi:hypothetical protein FV226_27600, partial [Methylobacterium sp. WL12]|uniref:hypothetical protein n=1 Tax=Methylobacterium sp. WL12 TaxID=2603890 RepID=UPI0011CBE09F
MSDAPARRVRNAPAPPPQQVRSKRHLTGRVAKESAGGNVLEKAEFSAEIINGAQTQLETEQIMDRFPHDIKSTSQIEDKITFLRISSRTEHVRSLALAYAFTVEANLNHIYKCYID